MKRSSALELTNVTGPLLTIADLAYLFKLHSRTIARLCACGELPRTMWLGGSRCWRPEGIDRLVNNSVEATGPAGYSW
jgi:hypothetical protein